MKSLLVIVALIATAMNTPTFAQSAQVACQDMFGNVQVRNGRCNFGEQMLRVMESRQQPIQNLNQNRNQNRNSYGGSKMIEPSGGRAYVACRDILGNINRRSGRCNFGETLVKVLN